MTQYRLAADWGYFQVSGLLRWLGYDTPGAAGGNPKGDAVGGGLSANSRIKLSPMVTQWLSATYGAGVSFYMNDGGTDLAFGGTTADPVAQAVPLLGLMAYVDLAWSPVWSTAVGYSSTEVWNTTLQATNPFKKGQYASVNLLAAPMKNIWWGPRSSGACDRTRTGRTAPTSASRSRSSTASRASTSRGSSAVAPFGEAGGGAGSPPPASEETGPCSGSSSPS